MSRRDVTDKERLLALLNDFGIGPETDERYRHNDDGSEVVLLAHHGGVEGYGDFFCVFAFDNDGKFESVGVWE